MGSGGGLRHYYRLFCGHCDQGPKARTVKIWWLPCVASQVQHPFGLPEFRIGTSSRPWGPSSANWMCAAGKDYDGAVALCRLGKTYQPQDAGGGPTPCCGQSVTGTPASIFHVQHHLVKVMVSARLSDIRSITCFVSRCPKHTHHSLWNPESSVDTLASS